MTHGEIESHGQPSILREAAHDVREALAVTGGKGVSGIGAATIGVN
jgi:hypothetical protein